MLKHTITTTDVKAMYERIKSRGPRDAYLGTRTEVHAELQAQLPPPYSDFPAHLPKDLHDDKSSKFSKEDLAEIHAHMRSQPTDAEIIAFDRAKAANPLKYRGVVDAHHYVQFEHGTALWAEADRLISEAGITEGGAS